MGVPVAKVKLRKPRASEAALQCRQLGIAVGDTIVGRETYSDGAWSESKLTLLFAGKQKCVFKVMDRSSRAPRWKSAGEATNWTLGFRDWYKVGTRH